MTRRPAWLDETELAAWVHLITLASRLVAVTDAELRRDHGITGRDYQLLHHLSAAPRGLTVGELARRIDDSSSCITHRINRLADIELVAKHADADDRRVRRVRITRAGRTLMRRAAPGHVDGVRRRVIEPLDRPDLVALGRITGLLVDHLRRVDPVGD